MSTSRRFLLLAGLAGLAMLGVWATTASSEEQGPGKREQPSPAPKPVVDRGKTLRIEPPVANLVRNSTAPAAPLAQAPPAPAKPVVPQPGIGFQGGFPGTLPRLDVGKGGFIEPRLQQALQHQFAGNLGTPNGLGGPNGQFGMPPAPPPAKPAEKTDFVNPTVEPGKVKWHQNYDQACAAAARSKKPVLLFHLMGKLDDKFC
jgi:hypothetical protein